MRNHSTESENNVLPFKEFSSSLSRYSDNNQLQARQYKGIIESQLGESIYQREFPSQGDQALIPLNITNANIPRRNQKTDVRIGDKNVNVYETFWHYKQPGATLFTDWESAGVQALKEDFAVRELPLHRHGPSDPTLILSNTNNVRNNFQNYGKEYLTTTNLLNTMAFDNGVSYDFNTSPYRTGTKYELFENLHGSFGNKENGDLVSRQIEQLRVDAPINYANVNMSEWQYINVAFIRPNDKLTVFHERLKYGKFDLDSMKLTGLSCLNTSFGMTPEGFDMPVDVLNDDSNFPPVENTEYYGNNPYTSFMRNGERTKSGQIFEGNGTNMYCSANTNFVTMPKNHVPSLKGLDTSFQANPGMNSITLGNVLSPRLINFIQKELYDLNKILVIMHIYKQEIIRLSPKNPGIYYKSWNDNQKSSLMKNIESNYPELFTPKRQHYDLKFDNYYRHDAKRQYEFLFNVQRNLALIHKDAPAVETFITHLSIFKFGGHPPTRFMGKVVGSVISKEIARLNNGKDVEIHADGVFLMLPTMLSDDLFIVRQEIPSNPPNSFVYPEKSDRKTGRGGNNCITSQNFVENATNCAFRDEANKWQQKPHPGMTDPNFIPNTFTDPNNLNDFIFNLDNPYAGPNVYNSPATF